MDRHLKERLVGAAILVFVAVLLIPEFLSGPAPQRAVADTAPASAAATGAGNSLRTYVVDLDRPASGVMLAPQAGPAGGGEAASVAPSVPGGSAPAPVVREATPSPPPPPPPPTLAPRAPVTPASKPSAPAPSRSFAPIDARGGWSLQLGSFANRANAEKLAQTWRARGIRVYVSGSGSHNRVRAGPFPDRVSAERAAAKLRSQGLTTSIVPP